MRALRPLPKATLSIVYVRGGAPPSHSEYLARIGDAIIPDAKCKLVLCMIARYVNNTSLECYPSIAKLAEDTALSEHSVQRAIKRLVADQMLDQRLRYMDTAVYKVLWHNLPYKVDSPTWRLIQRRRAALDTTTEHVNR